MSLRYVVQQLAMLAGVLCGLQLLMAAYAGVRWFLDGRGEAEATIALVIAAGVSGVSGAIGWAVTRNAPPELGRREALLLVALTWLLGAAYVGVPYLVWAYLSASPAGHPFRNVIDCYFEAMSGLSTTGATVLAAPHNIESIPDSLLLWRSFSQWVGGLGIVVLFVAVLPSLGVGGKKLFKIEAPGPSPEGLQPQIRQTARVLLYIYLVLTVTQFCALLLAGMGAFDAACHTFTTLATGGFSTRDASIGAYDRTAIEVIITIFMILAAMNFSLYFAVVRRRFSALWRDHELRTYAVVLFAGATLVTVSLIGHQITRTTGEVVGGSLGAALRHGLFTTVSISTTTGYCTADFNDWPFLAHATLIVLMFIGGSAGSTAGGIKAIRIWMAFKVMLSQIERVFRPQVVRPVRIGNTIIDNDLKLATITYVLGIVLLFAAGAAAVMLFETFLGIGCDFSTAASSSVASLCTIGPGLGLVGAVGDYGWMTTGSKIVLCLLMALGRLEVFAIIVLFNYRFWHED